MPIIAHRRPSPTRSSTARLGALFVCSAVVLGLMTALPGQARGCLAADPPAPDQPVNWRLIPRAELPKDPPIQPEFEHQLTVKFRDHVRARAVEGRLASLEGVNLGGLQQQADALGATFRPLIMLPDETIRFLEDRAERNSRTAQPDLAGMLVVDGPADRLAEIADFLHASDLTEYVFFQMVAPPPPCDDIPPTTPQYFPDRQGYHGPDPGIDMAAAWLMGSTRGEGIKVADCEYSFIVGHEDYCDIKTEPGQTMRGDWQDHGTAVLGQLVAIDNEYGCTGLVPDAEAWFFSELTLEQGWRRVTAIASAISYMDRGDVVLLEMQISIGQGFGPAELDPNVWTVVKNGTDSGVIVVAAAGNGDQNLDSSFYQSYMNRGDSGSIIVGAGTSNTRHDKLSFSTYGSRVNVQGWGQNVFTLGYGSFARHGNDIRQTYTATFSGTSSASPFVTAAAVGLQSLAVEQLGRRLTPLEMRDLLIRTGIPQGSGGHIGPFPDMVAAANEIIRDGRFELEVGRLVGGQLGEFRIRRATADERVHLIYSVHGTGSTYVPQLDVTLDLHRPTLGATTRADANGEASWLLPIPAQGSGRTVWFQAAQERRVSNVEQTRIE